jgi:hypothetical protein
VTDERGREQVVIDISSRWKGIVDKQVWSARGAAFVTKAKATKAVWFPPKPAATGKKAGTAAKKTTKRAAKRTTGAAKKSTAAAKKSTGTKKVTTPVRRKKA